ncbi:MAG: nucleoside recognition domain-containing protein [Oscillospiraceae bacterium]
MMNCVILTLILLSIVFGALLGRMPELTGAALDSGVSAIKLCVELCGTVALWCGIMKIAHKSGLCDKLSRVLSPVTGFLFRGLKEKSKKAIDSISLNITANLLGLGSAATPMALEAMAELDKLNRQSNIASDYMITFVVLNTASIQLLPTTVAAIRRMEGSANPLEIIGCVWLSSIASVIVAIVSAKLLGRKKKEKRQ